MDRIAASAARSIPERGCPVRVTLGRGSQGPEGDRCELTGPRPGRPLWPAQSPPPPPFSRPRRSRLVGDPFTAPRPRTTSTRSLRFTEPRRPLHAAQRILLNAARATERRSARTQQRSRRDSRPAPAPCRRHHRRSGPEMRRDSASVSHSQPRRASPHDDLSDFPTSAHRVDRPVHNSSCQTAARCRGGTFGRRTLDVTPIHDGSDGARIPRLRIRTGSPSRSTRICRKKRSSCGDGVDSPGTGSST